MAPRKSLSAIFFRKSYALPFASFQAVYWACFSSRYFWYPAASSAAFISSRVEAGSTAPYSIDFWYCW